MCKKHVVCKKHIVPLNLMRLRLVLRDIAINFHCKTVFYHDYVFLLLLLLLDHSGGLHRDSGSMHWVWRDANSVPRPSIRAHHPQDQGTLAASIFRLNEGWTVCLEAWIIHIHDVELNLKCVVAGADWFWSNWGRGPYSALGTGEKCLAQSWYHMQPSLWNCICFHIYALRKCMHCTVILFSQSGWKYFYSSDNVFVLTQLKQ